MSQSSAGGVSDMSDSDVDQIPELSAYSSGSGECSSKHDGREVMKLVLPTTVENLLTLLFTESDFLKNFYAAGGSKDLRLSAWHWNPNKELSRTIRVTVNINQALVGKFESHVTQKVVIAKCSKPGKLYAVDMESHNVGVPYADAFYVVTHYCLNQISDSKASLHAFSRVMFTKSLWIKGMLEKRTLSGIEGFHVDLTKCFEAEFGGLKPDALLRGAAVSSSAASVVAAPRRRRHLRQRPSFYRGAPQSRREEAAEGGGHPAGVRNRKCQECTCGGTYSGIRSINIIIFWMLSITMLLCGVLFYKLAALEEWLVSVRSTTTFDVDLRVLHDDAPVTEEQIVKLRKLATSILDLEAMKWEEAFHATVVLLEKVESSFTTLQNNVPSRFGENCSAGLVCRLNVE